MKIFYFFFFFSDNHSQCKIDTHAIEGYVGKTTPYRILVVPVKEACIYACTEDNMCYHVSAYPVAELWECSLFGQGPFELMEKEMGLYWTKTCQTDGMYIRIIIFPQLTLSQTSPGFYMSAVQNF